MPIYSEHTFRSRDGLKLYYRDYPGDPKKAPVLCLHGLTRNCRDFEALALRITPGRRVITPDFRGRGRSQYDSMWMNYHPMTYVDDMWALLREVGAGSGDRDWHFAGRPGGDVDGGGSCATFAGVVLNDIGPEVDPVGAARIRGYAGRFPPPRSWDDAVEQMKVAFSAALPDFTPSAVATVRSAFVQPRTAAARRGWKLILASATRCAPFSRRRARRRECGWRSAPCVTRRRWRFAASLSDLLSVEVFDRMQREHPKLQRVTIGNRGHVPQLDEPQSIAALEQFLAELP